MSVKKTIRRSQYGDSVGLQNFLQNEQLKISPRSFYQPSFDSFRDESTQINSMQSTMKRMSTITKNKRSTSINVPRTSIYNSSDIDLNNYEKNTNNYQHLFNPRQSPTSTREFAISLRSPIPLSARRNSPSKDVSPPKCYDETVNKKIANNDFEIHRERFDHLIRKRIGATVGHTQLGFEVALRSYNHSPQELSKEREWDPTQYKNSQTKTLFLPTLKQELKLKKTLKPPTKRNLHLYKKYMQNFEIDAFDGYHKYPQYTDKIVRSKNYNEIPPISRYDKDGDKPINQLKWELNLNNYPRRKVTEQSNN